MMHSSARHDHDRIGRGRNAPEHERDRQREKEKQRAERAQMLPVEDKDRSSNAADLFHAPVKVKPSGEDTKYVEVLGKFETVKPHILDKSQYRLIGVDQHSAHRAPLPPQPTTLPPPNHHFPRPSPPPKNTPPPRQPGQQKIPPRPRTPPSLHRQPLQPKRTPVPSGPLLPPPQPPPNHVRPPAPPPKKPDLRESEAELEGMLREMMDVKAPLTEIGSPIKDKKPPPRRPSKEEPDIVSIVNTSGMTTVPNPILPIESSEESSSSYDSSDSSDDSSSVSGPAPPASSPPPSPPPEPTVPQTSWGLWDLMNAQRPLEAPPPAPPDHPKPPTTPPNQITSKEKPLPKKPLTEPFSLLSVKGPSLSGTSSDEADEAPNLPSPAKPKIPVAVPSKPQSNAAKDRLDTPPPVPSSPASSVKSATSPAPLTPGGGKRKRRSSSSEKKTEDEEASPSKGAKAKKVDKSDRKKSETIWNIFRTKKNEKKSPSVDTEMNPPPPPKPKSTPPPVKSKSGSSSKASSSTNAKKSSTTSKEDPAKKTPPAKGPPETKKSSTNAKSSSSSGTSGSRSRSSTSLASSSGTVNRVSGKDSGRKSGSSLSASAKIPHVSNGDLKAKAKGPTLTSTPTNKKPAPPKPLTSPKKLSSANVAAVKEKVKEAVAAAAAIKSHNEAKGNGGVKKPTSGASTTTSSNSSTSSSSSRTSSGQKPKTPVGKDKPVVPSVSAGTKNKPKTPLTTVKPKEDVKAKDDKIPTSLVCRIPLSKIVRKPRVEGAMPAPPPPQLKVDKENKEKGRGPTGGSLRLLYDNNEKKGEVRGPPPKKTPIKGKVDPPEPLPSSSPKGKKRPKKKDRPPPKKSKTNLEADSHSKGEESLVNFDCTTYLPDSNSAALGSVSTSLSPGGDLEPAVAPDSSLNHVPSPPPPPAPIYFSYFERNDSHYEEDQDTYLEEAKRLKHKADNERMSTAQASTYLEAGMYFILTGISMERDRNIGSNAAYTMYKDTLSLIKYIGSRFRNRTDFTNILEAKIIVLSMRCQSMLSLRLFKMKVKETKDIIQYLNDHFHKTTPGTEVPPPAPVINSPQLSTPSPRSPHSSPAGSSGPPHLTPSHHPPNHHSMATIPRSLYSQMYKQCSNTMNLIQAHDLWEAGDSLVERYHLEEFLISIDRVHGPLTLNNSLLDLVRYVQTGLTRLKRTTSELL